MTEIETPLTDEDPPYVDPDDPPAPDDPQATDAPRNDPVPEEDPKGGLT